jgi:hypothetical protein
VEGLSRYLSGNAPLLFDYGGAWRAGQRILAAITESTIVALEFSS